LKIDTGYHSNGNAYHHRYQGQNELSHQKVSKTVIDQIVSKNIKINGTYASYRKRYQNPKKKYQSHDGGERG
jgi:hypothetical protein